LPAPNEAADDHSELGHRGGRTAGHARHRARGLQSKEDEGEIQQRSATSTSARPSDYSSARLWDDGVVDPADSRRCSGLPFRRAECADRKDTLGVFRM